MGYLGQTPFQEFASIPTKDSFTGDGSTTTFDLANDVVRGGENALEVFVNNVRQEPGSGKAFTLGVDGSNNYRRITFTAAPANGAAIYVINDKTNLSTIAPINSDFNGAELVLDADADTTIHADTDDEIDIRIGGSDVIMIKQSSGDGIITIPVDAKDLQFTQFDGNKVLEINDAGFVGVGGNSNAAGEIRIFEDSDNGSNYSGFKAAASTTGSVAYTLPAADGSSGTHLTTNGSGVLSWTASVSLANDTNNRVITGTGSGLNGEANLTFDGSTLAVTGALTASGAITGSSTVQGTTITATTAFVPDAADGAALGTTALEFSDLFLADASTIQFGADQDVTLTHVADTGVLLNAASVIQFRDSAINIGSPADGDLDINADDEIELNSTLIDINGNVEISGTLAQADAITMATNKKIIFRDAAIHISSTADGDMSIAADDEIDITSTLIDVNGNLDVSGTIVGASTLSATTITASTAFVPDASDGAALGTTALEFSDLFLADAAVIALGADQDVTLTHVADTGILLNSTNVIQFNDASQNIGAPSATVLDINATDEIELNATLVDVNANLDVSGTTVSAGVLTANAGIVVDNITIDGQEMDISAGGFTIDSAENITLDADGGNFQFSDGGTQILNIANSSSDVIIKPIVDAKDLIFQQRDGTEVMRIEDGAYASFAAAAVNPEATLTDASTISWNGLTSPVAKVTLGGNRTLGAASGVITGQFLSILFIQDGTGSRTMTFNAAYEHTVDVAPVLTTTANKGDLFVYRYNGAKFLEVGRNLNLTLS